MAHWGQQHRLLLRRTVLLRRRTNAERRTWSLMRIVNCSDPASCPPPPFSSGSDMLLIFQQQRLTAQRVPQSLATSAARSKVSIPR